jgi:hypothetical protein
MTEELGLAVSANMLVILKTILTDPKLEATLDLSNLFRKISNGARKMMLNIQTATSRLT